MLIRTENAPWRSTMQESMEKEPLSADFDCPCSFSYYHAIYNIHALVLNSSHMLIIMLHTCGGGGRGPGYSSTPILEGGGAQSPPAPSETEHGACTYTCSIIQQKHMSENFGMDAHTVYTKSALLFPHFHLDVSPSGGGEGRTARQ